MSNSTESNFAATANARRTISPKLSILFIGSLVATILLMALSGRLPRSSGELRLLFPYHAADLQRIEQHFGGLLSDVIIVDLPEDQSRLLDLEDDLSALRGVESVINPVVALGSNPPPVRLTYGSHGRFIVQISNTLSGDEYELLDAGIDAVLHRYADLAPQRIGAFSLSESITRHLLDENRKLVPFVALILGLLSFAYFRSVRLVVATLVAPLAALAVVMLIAGFCGLTLGPLSQLIPAFVLAVGTSYGVHVTLRARSGEDTGCNGELRNAILCASATTIAGLLSLLLFDSREAARFALLAAAGVFLSATFALTLTPSLLPSGVARPALPGERPLGYSGFRSLLFMLLVLIVGAGAYRIQIHAAPTLFLPSEDRQEVEQLQNVFPGNHWVSIVLERQGASKTDAELLPAIERVTKQLEALPTVRSVISPAHFYHYWESLPKEAQAELFSLGPSYVAAEEGAVLRILVESESEGKDLLSLRGQIRSVLDVERDWKPALLSSIELVVAEQSASLAHGVLFSIALTLGVVIVLLALYTRSLRLIIIGLVPNIVPVVFCFGLIGWCYQELHLGSALVGACALSLAVDNTFHFLLTYQEQRGADRVTLVLNQVFPAFLSSTIVLVAGFSVLSLSAVPPVSQFGVLLSTTLVVGFFADAMLLPWLVELKGNPKD